MPTAKPASGATLNPDNPGGFTTAFFINEGTGTTTTDASEDAIVGTLTNMDPAHEMDVSGGTGGNAAYNQTYSPAGSEGGKTKYVSADSNYKLSFYYEMDPDMDGAWYLWAASASMPWMDGYVSTKAGNVAANGGAYSNGFAVAEGDLGPDAWVTGGLNFDDDGSRQCVTVTSVSSLAFGTGDFTIAIGYEREEPDSSVGVIWCLTDEGYFNGILLSLRPASAHIMFPGGAWAEFPSVSAILATGSVHHIVIRAYRDGYAKLYHNGSYLAQADISSYSANDLQPTEFTFGGVTSHVGYGDNWNWEGKIHYCFMRAGMPSEATCATVSGDPYADMAAAESLSVTLADTLGGTDAITPLAGRAVSLADTFGATDGLTFPVVNAVELADTLGGTDALGNTAGLGISLSDALGGGDNATAQGGYASGLGDDLGAEDALAVIKSGDTDTADMTGFSESLTVTGGYLVSLTDGLSGGEELRSIHHGVPFALAGTSGLSDVAEMADGTVWLGRYAATGAMAAPLLVVDSYTHSYIGLCGDHGVYEAQAQVAECTGPSVGLGVLSLHPDGWALAVALDGTLQLWKYAAGSWTLAAIGARSDPQWALYRAALYPGYLRLEVIGGEIYVLPLNDSACPLEGWRLRGSVLQALPDDGLPVALSQYLTMQRATGDGGFYRNLPRFCYWRGEWHWEDGPTLRRYNDPQWGLPATASGALLNIRGTLTTIGEGATTYSVGSAAPAEGQTAARVLTCDSYRIVANDLDLWPVAARATGGATWLLGVNALDLWQYTPDMIGPGGTTPELDKWNWTGASLRLYTIGARRYGIEIDALTVEAAIRADAALASLTVEAATGGEEVTSPALSCLSVVAGIGDTEATSPALSLLTVEASVPAQVSLGSLRIEAGLPLVPQVGLHSLSIEAATGETSTAAVTLSLLTVAAALPGGATEPSPLLDRLTVQSNFVPLPEADVSLSLLTIEAASTVDAPAEGEGVFSTLVERVQSIGSLMLTTKMPVPVTDGWRAYYRADLEDLPFDQWESYTPLEIGSTITLDEPAHTVRLAIMGPLAATVTAFELQLYTEEEL